MQTPKNEPISSSSSRKERKTEEFSPSVQRERLRARTEYLRRVQDHQKQLALVRATIELYRKDIGIEPIWDIEVRILCPGDLPDAEAGIWWNEQVWYARLMMRCDAPDELVYYLVVHELYELSHWRTGNIFRYLLYYAPPDDHSQFLLEEHLRARNQEIEVQVRKFLGDEKRPYHLNGPYEFCNPHVHEDGEQEKQEPEPTVDPFTSVPRSFDEDEGEQQRKSIVKCKKSPAIRRIRKVQMVSMLASMNGDEPWYWDKPVEVETLEIYECPTVKMPAIVVG